MATSAAALNLDAWSAAVPVLLPYGARTMAGAEFASVGTFVPFLFFTLAMFNYLYRERWHKGFTELLVAGVNDAPLMDEGRYTRRSAPAYSPAPSAVYSPGDFVTVVEGPGFPSSQPSPYSQY